MNKTEIKQWIKEHKKIVNVVTGIALGEIVFGSICYKNGIKKASITDNSVLNKSIRDTLSVKDSRTFAGHIKENGYGLTLDNLGILGETLYRQCNIPKEMKFERFVLVSEPIKK